jgi:hypothetical protein
MTTQYELDPIELGRDLATVIQRETVAIKTRLAAIEARLHGIENRAGGVKMLGVWLDGNEYEAQNLVVHGGSLWCAQARTKSKPGSDGSWQLIVKQGTFSR